MSDSPYLGTSPEIEYAPTSEEKTLALLSHVLTFAVGFLAPLIIYLVKKDESAFVRDHAKESLNFQISITLIIILLFITVIGIFVVWIVGIFAAILIILATLKASEGKLYRYPFTIRLIK